jgi:hypothetical protein
MMKIAVIQLFTSGLLAGCNAATTSRDAILEGQFRALKPRFLAWKAEFKKEYKTAKELAKRMEVWFENHGKLFSCRWYQQKMLQYYSNFVIFQSLLCHQS